MYDCSCASGFAGVNCDQEILTGPPDVYGYAFGPFGPYQDCTVFIDVNSNMRLDAGEPTATTSVLTDTAGTFQFTNLDTIVMPYMRIIMQPRPTNVGGVTVAGDECPYLETMVPCTSEAQAGAILDPHEPARAVRHQVVVVD